MTLGEAIKILQYQGAPEGGPTISAFVEARQLGIEALKQERRNRINNKQYRGHRLPGETEK